MYRLIALLACSSLVSCQLYPGIGYNYRLNSAYPYNQGRYLNSAGFGAGYNGQYYNPASATAPILSSSNVKGPDGSYSYSFATGDGKQAQETGVLKNAYIDPLTGAPAATKVVEGSYSYTSPEGTPIQVQYVADENGFRTLGDHIPADGRGVLPAGSLGGLGYAGQGYNNLYNGYNRFNSLGF